MTLSLIMKVNHFQFEIKVMMAMAVPRGFTEPGGTEVVTSPT